uniref:C2H2-type domain-containing protein n=1 Tax=Globodera pallida TaxID=36090 RepID=A0A183CS45_GLOPA
MLSLPCRTTGFLCSVCEYKHESMGWLHLHCTSLHQRKEGVPFQWPPAYVKEGGGELLEETAATPRGERKGR